MALLKASGLRFWYEQTETPVIFDCSLSLKEGEFLAIVGESGSGKSTLLRLLCGLAQSKLAAYPGIYRLEGTIAFRDELVTGPLPDFSYVPQAFGVGLLPSRNAMSNILVAVWEDGISPAEREEAEWLMKITGITDVATLNIRKLSGGQQQRVAICRALITHPSLLFMDEPFANLDPTLRPEMSVILNQLRQEYELSLVIVTHDIEGALGLADRVVGLKPTYGTPIMRQWRTIKPHHAYALRKEIEKWISA